MIVEDTEIESAVRLALADRIGEERFDLWFGAGTRLLLARDTLSVEVADQFTLDWVRNHFRGDIEVVSNNVGPEFSTKQLGMGVRFTTPESDLRSFLDALCGVEGDATGTDPPGA